MTLKIYTMVDKNKRPYTCKVKTNMFYNGYKQVYTSLLLTVRCVALKSSLALLFTEFYDPLSSNWDWRGRKSKLTEPNIPARHPALAL